MNHKIECFALDVKDGIRKCRVLQERCSREYMQNASCGNDNCPFYKPRGQEKTYIRGLDKAR